MKKITFLAVLCCFFSTQFSLSQSINSWIPKKESEFSQSNLKRENIPTKYKTFQLDIDTFKRTVANAVVRDKDGKLSRTVLAAFPFEDGRVETFLLEKVNVLHPDLGAKYPQIQSYEGTSTDNRFNKIYITMYNNEFRGLITGEKTIYIDPYTKNDVGNYIVYDRSDLNRKTDDDFVCKTLDKDLEIKTSANDGVAQRNSTDGKLRTYDIAVACTSEYTMYHGNTIVAALAAVTKTITRVNSVYKRDLGVVFQIVAGNDRLIYRNEVNIDSTPDPDPYDNYDGSQMLNANTSNINGIIGSANYDIGHVFSTGGGGIAGTGPCTTTKGTGVTGIVTPEFDPFDIDYVCHEIGHQFGAGHTQNNACQISTAAAMEPGSGSTILGYAGICPPNIQNNSDAYFHAISIQQMTATISSNTCETETTITNAEPTIVAVPDYTIPKSTPFILTGSASDSDGDALTYCWEQMNNGTSSGTMPPVSTSTNRPAFRSFFPTTSPSRTFPNLTDIINNVTPTWEVLPSVARTLNFRLTVRDNNSLGGQTNQDNVVLTVGTAGPFAVTAPNTVETWYVGESKTVTWSVNSTNTATYSVNVNIKLSTDGGLTYPITLLSGTPNDGTQAITVPNNIGTQNRIKVEAAANIFFDISNANFEIKSNKFAVTATESTVAVCKPSSGVYTINYAPAPGFTETVTFTAVGLPSGATASFSPTSRNSAGTVTMTINGISAVATGIHNFNCNGTSTTSNINLPVTLKVFDSNIGTVVPSSPVNGAENQQTSVVLGWNALANAASYTVEIAASPSFTTLLETATVTTNSYQTTSLATGTVNYWRIRPTNSCLTGNYSETFSFQIASDYCKNYTDEYFEGNNVWELNSTNAVIAKIDVPDDVIISKVSFYMKATHASLADIKMQLSGPTGIFAEIFNRDCSGANIDITFDDSGVPLTCGNIDPLTSAAFEGIQQPSQPLSKFNGSSSLGTWTLLATDRGANTSGGTFNEFSVKICGKLQIVNNIIVDKEVQNVTSGATVVITQSKLLASQPTAAAGNLIYTITQLPTNGLLKNNGTTLQLGSTFTQANINSNLITYVHNGNNTNPESFRFAVTGLNSAYVGGESFSLNICAITNTASQTNVLCYGGNTGSATVAASGGTGAYTYLWSPSGGNAATASNLTAGNYSVRITDANGCFKDQAFTILQPTAAISNTVSQVNVLCFGSNTGSATVAASGGTGAYTYLWSPSGGNAATASNLAAGNYSVRITDANGCFKDQAFTILQPTAAISNTVSQVNVLCFGSNTGSATVAASGGTGAYTYLWSPSGGNAATASNLAAGNYSVRITDANGCFKDQAFTILQPTAAISNTVSQVNVLCFGSNTGSATVAASGGTGAYTYLWSPSGGNAATASNLTAGNYSVRITDANGCFKDQAFTILQPTAAISNTVSQVNVLCFGSNTGSATVTASGGTGAYTYLWSPSGGNAATASNLAAGNYSVRITDANGCFKDQAFTILQPTAAISNTVSQVNVLCFGSNSGSATVAASGGTGAYTYLWSPSGGNAATASNLAAGNYSVRITDANGCFKDKAFTILQPTAAISNTVSQVNVSCFGSNTGSATVAASGGTGAYTYLWSPSGGNAATASNLAAGNYSVRITDANGCFKDQAFTILQPTAAITNGVSQVNISCYGENTGSATVIPSGGSGEYTYLWTPSGGNAATATGLASGNYSCLITDSNGCTKTQNFFISQPVATTWNGSVWSNGIPVLGTKAIFNSNFTSTEDLTACSIEVNGNAIVTVLSGHDFNITNKVTVAGTAQLIFQNNANLIQTSELQNSGNITSNRTSMMRRQDYVYWSSPVFGQNLLAFSPLTLANRFYVMDGPTNSFVTINPAENDFAAAKGYMVRAPNTFPNTITQFDGKFTGVPNNGIKTIGVTSAGGGFNMIGNPYPSTLNANLFLNANPGTLYFWTHTTQVSNGPSNYATFNTMGGTAAAAGGAVPNGTIQVGQGYLIQKTVDGVATFNNGMRTGNNAGQFFRNPSEKHRIWLNLNNSTTAFNQILIGYMEGATQGKDESVDGILIDSGTSISSKIAESNFTIQGRALPFNINDIVPLNFNAAASGNYTLSIDHTDGLFAGSQEIYLKDNLLNVVHNMKQSAYGFASDAGTFANRFEIIYINSVLGTTPVVNENNLVVYIQDGIFNIKSVNTKMKSVKIFDIRGRLIYQKDKIDSDLTALSDFRAAQQVILVQVECEQGIIITKKAVY